MEEKMDVVIDEVINDADDSDLEIMNLDPIVEEAKGDSISKLEGAALIAVGSLAVFGAYKAVKGAIKYGKKGVNFVKSKIGKKADDDLDEDDSDEDEFEDDEIVEEEEQPSKK